jgi:hypothetical protein
MHVCLLLHFLQPSDEIKPAVRKFRVQETEYEKYYEGHQMTEQRQHVCFYIHGAITIT